MRDFFARMGVLGELMGFLWKRKLYWLLPMMIVLVVFALLVLGTNSPIAPFIYSIF